MLESHFAASYPPDTRFIEIEKLFGFVREGNSIQIIGLPGVGKSNLIGSLPYNRQLRIRHLDEKQNLFHFVLLNFSELRRKSLFDVTKYIFFTLLDSLRERDMVEEYEKTGTILKDSLSYRDEIILFQGLKRAIDFLAVEKNLTIVLLFDRFEEYIPMLTPDFFTNLRVLRNRAKYHFSAVFSLNRLLENTIEPAILSDFYEFVVGHIIYLPLLDQPGLDFRINYLEIATRKKLTLHLKKEILKLTSAHGKLTRIAIEIALSQNLQKVDSSILLQNKGIIGALLEIWNFLTPQERKLLQQMVSQPSSRHSERSEESPAMLEKEIKNETEFLTSIGLLQNNKITIPLLEDYIKHNTNILSLKSDIISFDPDTNSILKGKAVISERLTVSEFRLLRFLLENPNKVVEKNDIISAVWQESKQTLGVSDQALDQLIFRLRKKIEDDPNNPTHIITVKGRGLKFNP